MAASTQHESGQPAPARNAWFPGVALFVIATGLAAIVGIYLYFLPGWDRLLDKVVWVPVSLGLAAVGPLLLLAVRSSNRVVSLLGVTASYVYCWQWLVALTDAAGLSVLRAQLARYGLAGLFVIGLLWVIWAVERASQSYAAVRRGQAEPPGWMRKLTWMADQARAFARVLGLPAVARFVYRGLLVLVRNTFLLGVLVTVSLGLIGGHLWYILRQGEPWMLLLVVAELALVVVLLAVAGYYRVTREEPEPVTNPLDQEAWYYGRAKKLNQSLAALCSYTLAFFMAVWLSTQLQGCKNAYEMPAGGGVQQTVAQTVKIQKVIRKKFVINPFSSIIFNPPPIEEIKLYVERETEHLYNIGDGGGEGPAGFSQGTGQGKVRFIRLQYTGGDWDQDFGVGADLNMLIQHNILTRQKVHDNTESLTIGQLANCEEYKFPPFVYMTGQRNISLSKNEVESLREYLLEHHGMIFADNGGSRHFHSQFFNVMKQILPDIKPVVIPRDDIVHRVPFAVPELPYVAPHGGDRPWGWKNPDDGRWLVYYHPGDIGDAWSDGHAGVPRAIYESCYQLGSNIINYAYTEYNRWLVAQKQDQ